MKSLGIIPARYASTRFPGKPLIDIGGKTMIRRVYEQSLQSRLDKIVVATDDERIAEEVGRFGGEVILTAATHQSGTDRCAEVAEQFPDFDIVVNIQGDEPFIAPEQINLVRDCFNHETVELATLIKKIEHNDELFNINIPKVVINEQQEALYFSRHPIPFLRNQEKENWLTAHSFYKHIGIYGYRRIILLALTRLRPSSLETAESLEQLRWLENGYRIRTQVTTLETLAIDTPDDLLKINIGG